MGFIKEFLLCDGVGVGVKKSSLLDDDVEQEGFIFGYRYLVNDVFIIDSPFLLLSDGCIFFIIKEVKKRKGENWKI